MHLSRQQKIVYEFIRDHQPCTVQAIRDGTLQRKPDMRISEINFAYQLSQDIEHPDLKDESKNLIINQGRNKYREVFKVLRVPLTRKKSEVVERDGKFYEQVVELPL